MQADGSEQAPYLDDMPDLREALDAVVHRLAEVLPGVYTGRVGPVPEMDGRPASAEDAPHAGLGSGGHADETTREDRQEKGRKPGGGMGM